MNGDGATTDRRKHTRTPLVIQVKHVLADAVQYYFTSDLSLGGIFLKTKKPFGVGTELELEFQLEGIETRLTVKGRVARVVEPSTEDPYLEPGMGIAFTYIDPVSKAALKMFLEEL